MNADQFHDVDAVKWLKEIAAENKLDVTYVNIEEKSKSSTRYFISIFVFSAFFY